MLEQENSASIHMQIIHMRVHAHTHTHTHTHKLMQSVTATGEVKPCNKHVME
jgi:hypothetical protein